MKKLLLFSMLSFAIILSGRTQVVFDPSTYNPGDLPANMSIVNIDGTDYLQVVTDGWDNLVDLDPVIITHATEFSAMAKLSIAGSDTLSLSEVNTFLKLTSAFADTVEIGAAGAASSDTFQLYTVVVAVQDTINILQVAAQQTISWDATTGDTLWIGKVKVSPAPVNEFAVDRWTDLHVQNITDSIDYSAKMNLSWNDSTFVIVFNITDDVLYNDGGNIWELDNTEFYVDMNNSKGAAFDADDYQFRLVNDSTWENTVPSDNPDVGGVILENNLDTLPGGDTVGYTYSVTIPWDSLSVGFIPEIGKQIGFDVLTSDNDGNPYYRDQITWKSPSHGLFNTPYFWGVLEFSQGGKFLAIDDNEAPTVPANLTATADGTRIHLDWDDSEDNRHVANYIIYQEGDEIDGSSASAKNITDLAPGTYSFTVAAEDIYGNVSAQSEAAEATIRELAVEENMTTYTSIYPNPTDGLVNITSKSPSAVIIEVYTSNGTTVITDTFQKDYIIDLSGVPEGMYFLRLKTDNKVQTKKLIVK